MPSFLDLGACIILPLSTGLPQTSPCTGPSFSLPLGSFGLALPPLHFCHFILRNNHGCGVDHGVVGADWGQLGAVYLPLSGDGYIIYAVAALQFPTVMFGQQGHHGQTVVGEP